LPEKLARSAAIEGPPAQDLKRIVAFWTVFGSFSLAEFFIDFFVFIIPMYFEIKIIFLIWLVHNDFSGAMFCFDNIISELLSNHAGDIDISLEKSKTALKRQISAGVGSLADVAAQAGVAALKKVTTVFFLSKERF
jgi:hypothetical protein